MTYHSQPIAALLKELDTNPFTGLSEAEALARQKHFGANALPEAPSRSLLLRFFSQFADFMILVLFAAASISFGVSLYEGHPDYIEPLIILAIILLNALMGTIQETRAEHSLNALRKLAAPKVPLLRNGKRCLVAGESLVPGDVLFLETGQIVPADARLLTAVNLRISEASLTGESLPVRKDATAILPVDCLPADRKNCVFSSCVVAAGHGTAIVTGTGLNTEIGTIASHLIHAQAPETPLQKRLAAVGKALGILCLAICAGIFLLGIAQGRPPIDMLLTAVSLAVAAIPEGLPAVVTIMLSIGVERMARGNAIIRRLPAVETLGSATYICSDKTGTLTQNRMTAVSCIADGIIQNIPAHNASPAIVTLLRNAALCCNSDGENGEPTENALVSAALKLKVPSTKHVQRLFELPFSSERKAMFVVIREADGTLTGIAKGAPDILFEACQNLWNRRELERCQQSFAAKGLRMLAVAIKTISAEQLQQLLDTKEESVLWHQCISDLHYVGTLALWDPPRPECFDAVMQCRRAGITPVMITGDHPTTALTIAKELGIATDDSVISGAELIKMSDEQLRACVRSCHVYARVQPEHKVRIVQALQSHGEVVAMTGDGVNDAPALKQADIGCAMGLSGTDVAKNAADMILTDDNFATIVAAVREGRGIYDNIRKAVHFLLSCNAGEILLIVIAMLCGLPAPLAAIQLLWINLVTDSLPAIALAVEPPEENVMRRRPIAGNASLFPRSSVFRIALEGAMVAVLAFIAYVLHGSTCCFFVLGCSELLHTLNIKNDRSLFRSGLFENTFLTAAILFGLLLQVATVTFAPLMRLFAVTSMTAAAFFHGILLSLAPIVVSELEKFLILRKRLHARRRSG